ncbi:MAG: hypothetical protein ACLPVY_18430 [Acidimicrobiia bacterium]
MIWAQMRPAMPYVFGSVSLLALGLLVTATTTPPMTSRRRPLVRVVV